MLMFQSVSGHSSEKGVAQLHHSYRVSLILCQTGFDNRQPQRTQISTITKALFIQNMNQMAFSVDHKFSECVLSTPAIFKAMLSFSVHIATLMVKIDLTFPAFSQFNSAFAVSFHFTYKKPCKSSLIVA